MKYAKLRFLLIAANLCSYSRIFAQLTPLFDISTLCGFRQEAEGEGALQFVLGDGADVGAPIRTLFQILFGSGWAPSTRSTITGETAMHGAAYKNLPGAVEFLAAKGAKIEIWNQKNKHGRTPLTIAEGYRFGNFKPSLVTVAAFHKVMKAAGVAVGESQPLPAKPAVQQNKAGR